MMGLDGKMIPPTNKKFKVDFCTVAHWKNGKIVEENLFYDLVGMMTQLGLMRAGDGESKAKRRKSETA
jgi:ketosteroid isomerase-like protein